jgi:hypothetical protein
MMIRAILLCILMQAYFVCVSAQEPLPKALVDSCIRVMKTHSINATSVSWPAITTQAYALAEEIKTPAELGTAIRYLFKSIDDDHGAFFYQDSVFRWTKKKIVFSDSIRNEWNKRVKVVTRMLKGKIGYLRVPSMPIAQDEEFNTKAQELNDSLCVLLSADPKGIVLDLRLNGGGAMHPMILGLENLLGDGIVGAFHTKSKDNWIIANHQFSVGGKVISTVQPRCLTQAKQLPVVLLIGPGTGSSGEFLIMAFKGRGNINLVGTETAGLVSVNTGYPIGKIAFMNLAVGYGSDRTGKIYKSGFIPDIPLESADNFNAIEKDEKVLAAKNWILKSSK